MNIDSLVPIIQVKDLIIKTMIYTSIFFLLILIMRYIDLIAVTRKSLESLSYFILQTLSSFFHNFFVFL